MHKVNFKTMKYALTFVNKKKGPTKHVVSCLLRRLISLAEVGERTAV